VRDPVNPLKNNLVSLSSAAVLAVYAAGYVRTRAAADLVDAQSEERRPAVAASAAQPTAVAPSTAGQPVHDTASASQARLHQAAGAATAPVPAAASGVAGAASPTVAPATPDQAALAQGSTPATASAPNTAAAADSSPVDSSVVAGATPTTAVSPKQPDKPQALFKDGVYMGWGSSRHGQIEAAIEVRDGRIISASITQCLMHYSCSWISMLPPQVVARQSPEVDYVSGATQSVNAFYFAVVDALSRAK
jgi:uncharacterized protein with FMN-binding domain